MPPAPDSAPSCTHTPEQPCAALPAGTKRPSAPSSAARHGCGTAARRRCSAPEPAHTHTGFSCVEHLAIQQPAPPAGRMRHRHNMAIPGARLCHLHSYTASRLETAKSSQHAHSAEGARAEGCQAHQVNMCVILIHSLQVAYIQRAAQRQQHLHLHALGEQGSMQVNRLAKQLGRQQLRRRAGKQTQRQQWQQRLATGSQPASQSHSSRQAGRQRAPGSSGGSSRSNSGGSGGGNT